jgi:hypothetical protein
MRARRVSFIIAFYLIALCLCSTSCRDSETAPKQTPIGNFNMGEKALVGSLIYTVIDTKWEVSLGDPPTPRVPSHRFYLLTVSVVNTGSGPASIPAFTLIDDSGQNYQELDNGEGVPDWIGLARRVQPADSLKGNIAFDVPQKHFKLRVADEEDKFSLVDIPFSLGTAPTDDGIKAPPR